MSITTIVKRDFSKRPFEISKVTNAVLKAMESVNNGDLDSANSISRNVYSELESREQKIPNYIPSVEEIQDVVEQQLMKSQFLQIY